MLSDVERRFLAQQRIAHLATADRRAVPHVMPVCFAVLERTLYITIDEKPKRRAPAALKRLRNIAENPAVAVIVDRYDEDWARLGWVMLRGHAFQRLGARPRDTISPSPGNAQKCDGDHSPTAGDVESQRRRSHRAQPRGR